tara:strand:+ start:12 stop:683 length:672 start_codon:yes stop_codon:yes gene_type:complete
MSPFESAWLLLKRQTELGEFHPWLPSSHGPANWYHGTSTDHAKGIHEKGILPGTRQAITGRTDYTEEGVIPDEEELLDASIPAAAFITPSLESAKKHAFFGQNARNALGSKGGRGMVGIRAEGLAEAIKRGEINPHTGEPLQTVPLTGNNYGTINQGAVGIAGGIPRKYTTPVLPDMLFGHDQQKIEEKMNSPYAYIGYQQPMPLDWSSYDRFNQDQNFPDMI